ncbi:MAG TPA: aspartyl/asparaginyl beta-hydroxylase domain-containing protein [Bacteroidia bacterium]|jgi:aspartyl/asparaginyl beta-hydroxylase (cupin superfamily)|nr:aspartyl/asparaginyl beta-hydroxylase domain-containing protein [Bacteroidia bacterium]
MKLWFSIFDRNDYKGSEPEFFDPSDYRFSDIILKNYDVINRELNAYLQKNKLKGYFNTTMVAEANSWRTISLKTWGVEMYENHRYFPETISIIRSVPGLVSASFNLLEPRGHIIPHCGDTNGIFRCHFGLSIPGKIPDCGFKVRNEWRSWENGKLLVFVDANKHEAINNTDQNRFIFLFDVVREEMLHRKKFICAMVLTSLFLQARAEKFRFLYKAPMFMQKLIAGLLMPLVYVAIPIRNSLYKFKKQA